MDEFPVLFLNLVNFYDANFHAPLDQERQKYHAALHPHLGPAAVAARAAKFQMVSNLRHVASTDICVASFLDYERARRKAVGQFKFWGFVFPNEVSLDFRLSSFRRAVPQNIFELVPHRVLSADKAVFSRKLFVIIFREDLPQRKELERTAIKIMGFGSRPQFEIQRAILESKNSEKQQDLSIHRPALHL